MSEQPNYNITPFDADQKVIGLNYKPTPSDRELEWDKTKTLLSKTDAKGNILYANEAFIDVSGYDDFELMNKPHSLLRHPDMPKVIFKLLWENINKGENYMVVIKNMSKTGRYYWIVNDVKSGKDSYGSMTFTGQQQSIKPDVVNKIIDPLFKKLLHIEQASGVQASENYLIGFLEDKGKTLPQFFYEVTSNLEFGAQEDNDDSNETSSPGNIKSPIKKKGFFTGFFADTPETKKK